VFALAVLARMLFLAATGAAGRVLNDDGYSYNRIAQSLLAGAGFAFGPADPTALRSFGYPPLLAGVYGIAGPTVVAVQWLQAVASGGVAVVTFALARRLFDGRVALLAGAGVALHPVLLYLAGLIAPDALALLAEMALLWFALGITCGQSRRWGPAVGYVLSGAAAILLRPELVLVVALAPAAYLVYVRKLSTPARTMAAAAAIAVLVACAPPTLRNAAEFQAFIPFPTIGGVTFWGANNAVVDGGWVMPSSANWPDPDPPASMRGWPGLTEQQSQARFYQASVAWMTAHPEDALSLIPRKLARSWTLSYADERKAAALPPGIELANILFGALAAAGAVVVVRRYRSAVWLLFTPVVAWLVKTVVFYGSARQTALVLPILVIFTAVAVMAAADRATAKTIRSPASECR
jgi:4-amino-4-deoxy-L-arabinose transferase-like glycosyltransferase